MAKKAILQAGIRFDPKDIDVSAIRKTLVQSIGQAKVAAARAGGGARSTGTAGGQRNIQAQTQKSIQFLRDYHTQVSQSDKATLNYMKLLKQGAGGAEEFGAKIGQITTRFGAYLVSLKALFAVQRAFNESLEFITKFDDALQNLQKVLTTTPDELEKAARGIFEIAQVTGNSALQVSESFNVFIRSGIKVEEALEKAKAALIAVNISELNVVDATKLIISTSVIFRKEIENDIEALDILSVTADNAATSAGEIAKGLLRSGAAAEAVGVSYKELNAIIAATEEATKLGGGRIGSALKTIFARLAANEEQFKKQVNALGATVQVGDSVVTIFGKLSQIWENLNRNQKQQIAQTLAGKRRFTEFNAIIANYGRTTQLLEKQLNSSGTAIAKNEIELKKLSTKAQQTAVSFAELISEITGIGRGEEGIGSIRDSLAAILEATTKIGGGFTDVIKFVKSLEVSVFSVTSLFKTLTKVGIFAVGVPILKRILQGFREFVGLTGALKTSLSSVANAQSVMTQKVSQTNVQHRIGLDLLSRKVQASLQMDRILGRIQSKEININRTRALARGKGLKGATETITTGKTGAALIGGVIIASDLLSDAMRTLTANFEEHGTVVGRFNAAITSSISKGLEMGTIFGLLTNSLQKGLLVGVIALSASLIKSASQIVGANLLVAVALETASRKSVTFALAIARGGKIAEEAFKEISNVTKDTGTVLVNESLLLQKSFKIARTGAFNLEKRLNKFASVAEDISRRVSGIGFATELKNEFKKIAVDLRKRELAIELKISGGGAKLLKNMNKVLAESRAELEQITGKLKTSRDFTLAMERAARAHNEVMSGTRKNASEILTENNLRSSILSKIVQQEVKIKEDVSEIKNEIAAATEENQRLANWAAKVSEKLENSTKKLKESKTTQDQITVLTKSLAEINKKRSEIQEQLNRKIIIEKKIQADLANIAQLKNEQADKEVKAVSRIVEKHKQAGKELKLSVSEIKANTEETRKQIPALKIIADFDKEIAKQRFNARTLGQQQAVEEKALRRQILNSELKLSAERGRAIQDLAAEEAKAIANNDAKRAQNIKKQRDELIKASKESVAVAMERAEIELEAKLAPKTFENIERAETALSNFRINAIESALQKEEQAASRRILLIEQLGKSAQGKEFLREEFKPSQFIEREFGLIGGIIVKELEASTEKAVELMTEKLEELKSQGGDAFQILEEAQRTRSEVEQKLDDLTWRKREILINKVKDATDAVAKAEERLIQERNKLPELNAKVIEAQKNLGAASKDVDSAMTNLRKAMSAASDAQADLSFNTLKAAHDARVATGSLGARGALSGLSSIFNQIVNTANVSGQKLLEIRAQLAKEEISILQGQFNTVKGLGIEAATATEEQFAKIQEGLGVAGAISAGADVSRFTPEQLSEAMKRKDLFEGVERKIAEFGLKELGLSADLLQTTESQMTRLAEISAQTGQSQVNAANAQVLAAQQQLVVAEEGRADAKEGLVIAKNQLAVQEATVAVANHNARASVLGFDRIAFAASKQLAILNENRIATDKLGGLLSTIDKSIQNATKDIVTSLTTQLSKVGSSLTARAAAGVPIPTVAGGSLSTGELGGLMSAAKSEKRAMPAGSRLMLANTSETVLTKRQSSKLGLRSIPKRFAADGNAAEATGALTTAVSALITKLSEPGLVNQNINVQVDTERNVNVRGLDALDGAMRRAFEAKSRQFANKEEQNAVNDVVTGLVEKLSEMGVINSRGV